MAKLIYSAITSLDGFVADETGKFAWAAPDDEVHTFVNDLERTIGTHLFGRRMYEVMQSWENIGGEGESDIANDYAQIWRSADKIVYSRTLDRVSSAKTRIERALVPDAVRQMKAHAGRDVSIGGPELAAHALGAGLVDELRHFVTPFIIGNGNHWLPHGLHMQLELLDERRFRNGVVYTQYTVKR